MRSVVLLNYEVLKGLYLLHDSIEVLFFEYSREVKIAVSLRRCIKFSKLRFGHGGDKDFVSWNCGNLQITLRFTVLCW